MIDRELVGANHFNYLTAKAFFKFINTVFGAFIRETVDAVKIITFEMFFGGVFYHVPLELVLGVVVFHVLFIAAREKIDHFGAVEHKHSC